MKGTLFLMVVKENRITVLVTYFKESVFCIDVGSLFSACSTYSVALLFHVLIIKMLHHVFFRTDDSSALFVVQTTHRHTEFNRPCEK